MNIEWVNERYKESKRIFDSEWEVSEWADSLYPDFGGGFSIYVGYASPDERVHNYLVGNLPKWTVQNNRNILINTSIEIEDEQLIYKIWVTPK